MTYNFGSYKYDTAIEKAISMNIKAIRICKSINNVIIAESDKGVYAFIKRKISIGSTFSVKTKDGIWFIIKIILKYKKK